MEEDETVCGRCANSKKVVYYSADNIEVDIEDEVPLISRQQLITTGASNLMVHWVSHVTKLVLSGLVTSAALIAVLILYIVVAKAEDPTQGHIFFVDLSEEVTWQRLCAAESIVRRQSNIPCYFYLISDPIPALTHLSDMYPNLYVRKWNWIMNIRETPMEPWINHLEHLQTLLYTSSKDVLEMTARVLTLWKYGGTSTSLGKIHEGECGWLMDMNDSGNHNIVDESDGAFIKFDPCHVLMEKVIAQIMNQIESGKTINSTELLTVQLQLLCKDPKIGNDKLKSCIGIAILGPTAVCHTKTSNYVSSPNCPRIQSYSGFRIEKGDSYKKYEF